jgi:hypothetical protein
MSQLACPCCGERDLDRRLEPALDELERIAGAPLEIVEGYRCVKYNAGRMSVSVLAHMQGRAADLRIAGFTLTQLYHLALEVPAFREGGIGLNDDGSIHVDVRIFPARWGRVKGLYLGIETSGLLKEEHHGECDAGRPRSPVVGEASRPQEGSALDLDHPRDVRRPRGQ